MEKLKKVLTIVSLATLGVAIAMLIGAVFGLKVFKDPVLLKILLTAATISVTAGMAINETAVIKRKRVLGFVGLSLLLASATLAIIMFIFPKVYNNVDMQKATSIIAISSLLFVTVISYYSKLESSMLALQLVAYGVFLAFDVIVSLLICGVNVFLIGGMIQTFAVICIVAVGLMIALTVLSSKRKSSVFDKDEKEPKLADDKMIVSKAEYDALKEENEKLKEQKVDEDKMLISKAEYYSLKEENLKLKEELMQLKKAE